MPIEVFIEWFIFIGWFIALVFVKFAVSILTIWVFVKFAVRDTFVKW